MISTGSIISVVENDYIDYPGGEWHDHFAPRKHYYKVLSISNNGSIRAIGIGGKTKWLDARKVKEVRS